MISGLSNWTRRWKRWIRRLRTSLSLRRPGNGRYSFFYTYLCQLLILYWIYSCVLLIRLINHEFRDWSWYHRRTSLRYPLCKLLDQLWLINTVRGTLVRDTMEAMSMLTVFLCSMLCYFVVCLSVWGSFPVSSHTLHLIFVNWCQNEHSELFYLKSSWLHPL